MTRRSTTLAKQRVNQKLSRIDPVTWNHMINAARQVRKNQALATVGPSANNPWGTDAAMRNTQTNLLRGNVLGLEVPFVTPQSGDPRNLLNEGPNFRGVDPDEAKHWGKAGVLWEAAPTSRHSQAHIAGPAIARVHIDDAAIDHCDVWTGNFIFRGHWSGSWRILWMDPDATIPGEVICIVNYRGAWQREMKATVKEGVTITAPGSGLVIPVINDVAHEELTAHHNWFTTDAADLEENLRLLVKWFYDELKWVIVAAEC